MGYEIHITRKEQWSDEDGPVIEADEWAELVDDDDELAWDANNGEFDVLWSVDGTPFWFEHESGMISTKNPSTEAMQKMYRIAEALSAVVQGDEGELYDARGEMIPGSCEEPPPSPVPSGGGLIRKLVQALFARSPKAT